MPKDIPPSFNMEFVLDIIKDLFDIPSPQQFDKINERLDRIEKLLLKGLSEEEGTKGKEIVEEAETEGEIETETENEGVESRVEKRKTNTDVVLDVISGYKTGVSFNTIKKKSGFDDKKLRNIVFRLAKLGRIKRVKRGVYKKA